jgi:hypothetical protein
MGLELHQKPKFPIPESVPFIFRDPAPTAENPLLLVAPVLGTFHAPDAMLFMALPAVEL